jgi:hypothetical protein
VSCSHGSVRPAQIAAFPLSSPAALIPRIRIGRTVAVVSSSDCKESRKPNWLWQYPQVAWPKYQAETLPKYCRGETAVPAVAEAGFWSTSEKSDAG